MSRPFADSCALIVGGTSGVGLATARELLAAGCKSLAIVGRDPGRGEAACSGLACGERARFIRGDARSVEDVVKIVDEAEAVLGRIDILMTATAPDILPELIFRTPLSAVPDIIAQLVNPPLLMTTAVVPIMRSQRHGVILNVASDAAKSPTPGESVIGAGMAAISMFTRTVAIEGKRDGIRANVLTPSLITGTLLAERILKEGFSKRLFEKAADLAELGVATPVDLAALAVFLASPAASRLTGQAISVNGGISAL
jgi:NAD(P)-dependent dehydrogenase (short-subunit alcohol dehydrogenase family)